MSYLIIANANELNIPVLTAVKLTEEEAQQNVSDLIEKGNLKAFYIVNPDVDLSYITVDMDAGTITVDTNQVEADRTERARSKVNEPFLRQINAKERQASRSMRELMRERQFPGDLTPEEKEFARQKIRRLDQEISVLRDQLT